VADSTDRRRLGRGLASLLGDQSITAAGEEQLLQIPRDEVFPNPNQPRKRIDDAALAVLADSITRHGLVQPIVVRQRTEGGYELIAGERRWRAAGVAGLTHLPALVRASDAAERLELALVENMVREDLSPIEVALACATLIEDFHQTQQEVASRLGRSRSAVANLVRLLELPEEIQTAIDVGTLSEGHGRAILMADGPRAQRLLAERVTREGLSVRQTEALATTQSSPSPRSTESQFALDNDVLDGFATAFDTPVRIRVSARGEVVVQLRFSDEAAVRAALGRLSQQ